MTSNSSEPELILGIDGGGTKTVALLAERNSPQIILGKGSGGPSNQRAVGPDSAMNNLDDAVAMAFEAAGLSRRTVAVATLGLAGADRTSDRRVVEQWAQQTRLAHHVLVVNDAVPLLHAGESTGTGVALIAGTGSLAWGLNQKGQSARSGGWGFLFSDEGSAFALGRAILQAVSWSADGRGPTTHLTHAVLQALQISSTSDIIPAVYSQEVPRAVIAGLAPLVFDQANRMDVVACDILNSAATDLASMAVAVTNRLEIRDHLCLSLAGALMVNQQKFREMVLDAIRSRGIQIMTVSVISEPATGSLRMSSALTMS